MSDSTTTGSTSNISGGVKLTNGQTSIGGDVVGRDKVTQVQGDQINTYIQLDLAERLETLKQALPENAPLLL